MTGMQISGRPPATLSRRRLLEVGGLSVLGLGLPRLLDAQAPRAGSGGAPRSCIFIYQYGGLSQLDSWDLKPQGPEAIRGPYRPIATSVPGMQIGELMPRLATLAQHYCVIRSLSHAVPIHDVANRMLLDAFLNAWQDADRKQAIIEELADKGVFFDELAEQIGTDFDPFDLICHVAFDAPPLTRKERADKVRKRHLFAQYGEQTRAVLDALLDKFADGGIRSVESMEILKVDPLTAFGTPLEIVKLFGDKSAYLAAIKELEAALYQKAA